MSILAEMISQVPESKKLFSSHTCYPRSNDDTFAKFSFRGGGEDGKRPGATEFEKKRRKKHIPTDPIKFNLITLDPPLLPSVCRRAKKGKSLKTHVEFAKFAFSSSYSENGFPLRVKEKHLWGGREEATAIRFRPIH